MPDREPVGHRSYAGERLGTGRPIARLGVESARMHASIRRGPGSVEHEEATAAIVGELDNIVLVVRVAVPMHDAVVHGVPDLLVRGDQLRSAGPRLGVPAEQVRADAEHTG